LESASFTEGEQVTKQFSKDTKDWEDVIVKDPTMYVDLKFRIKTDYANVLMTVKAENRTYKTGKITGKGRARLVGDIVPFKIMDGKADLQAYVDVSKKVKGDMTMLASALVLNDVYMTDIKDIPSDIIDETTLNTIVSNLVHQGTDLLRQEEDEPELRVVERDAIYVSLVKRLWPMIEKSFIK